MALVKEASEPYIDQVRKVFSHTFLFSDRPVNATVISCEHFNYQDTEFILNQLSTLNDNQDRTIFIEQGSPSQKDHVAFQLKALASRTPVIAIDFERRMKKTYSLIDDSFWKNDPFASSANYWLSRGRKVVNMDLSTNISPEAISALIELSSPKFAIEIVYHSLTMVCNSSRNTIPLILKEVFPMLPNDFILQQSQRLYQVYRHLKRKWEVQTKFKSVREKGMVSILSEQLRNGDIILAHPDHISQIMALAENKS